MDKIKVLDSFDLKCVAFICMIIDHIAMFGYFYLNPYVYFFMRVIGRISMPIFAFLIYEGFKHTSNLKRYIARMGIAALATEIILSLVNKFTINLVPDFAVHINCSIKILTSFTLSLILLWAIDIIMKNKEANIIKKIVAAFIIVDILIAFFNLNIEFKFAIPYFIVLTYIWDNWIKNTNIWLKIVFGIVLCVDFAVLSTEPINILGLIALPLIALYSGKKGKSTKRLFYYLYPIQYVLIYLVSIYFYMKAI